MGMAEQIPDWDKCPFNDDAELLEKLSESHVRVGAKEFWPEGARSWEGLPFRDWYNYVMSQPVKE